jgi:hypothetical protein
VLYVDRLLAQAVDASLQVKQVPERLLLNFQLHNTVVGVPQEDLKGVL